MRQRKRNGINRTESKNVATAASPSPDESKFPNLNTDAFHRAWRTFELHRKELRKPLTPTARHRLLAKLAAWGVDRAVAALETSVANGWRGVFEPKSNGQAKRNGRHRETLVTGEELAHVREL